jgi:cystathionine beta-lyase family protein involved in aluminum resistance
MSSSIAYMSSLCQACQAADSGNGLHQNARYKKMPAREEKVILATILTYVQNGLI